MKVRRSTPISPFGGLNFMLEELDKRQIGTLLDEHLPALSPQYCYGWQDIFYSFWSVFLCGGDCAEDLGDNLKTALSPHPKLLAPSPDRVLDRLKELAVKNATIQYQAQFFHAPLCSQRPVEPAQSCHLQPIVLP